MVETSANNTHTHGRRRNTRARPVSPRTRRVVRGAAARVHAQGGPRSHLRQPAPGHRARVERGEREESSVADAILAAAGGSSDPPTAPSPLATPPFAIGVANAWRPTDRRALPQCSVDTPKGKARQRDTLPRGCSGPCDRHAEPKVAERPAPRTAARGSGGGRGQTCKGEPPRGHASEQQAASGPKKRRAAPLDCPFAALPVLPPPPHHHPGAVVRTAVIARFITPINWP